MSSSANLPLPDGSARPDGSELPRVVVLYGGRSSEHSISCVSAGSVLAAIDRERWDVRAVGITTEGRWLLGDGDAEPLAIRDGVLPRVTQGRDVLLQPRGSSVHLIAVSNGSREDGTFEDGTFEDLGAVDVVFPLLHGPWGEDGSIQGWLESVGVAYVGSGVLASAVAMDKAAMKAALATHGIPIGPYEVVHDGEWRLGRDRVRSRLEFALALPVFVKPARAGSSIGISKVSDWADLPAAVDEARRHDPKVVVEEGIAGAELECGVLDGGRDQRAQASVCAQITLVGDREFYDFEAKYLDDAAELIVPASIPAQDSARLRDLAVRCFEALECEGLARVDFFLSADGRIIVNEVNTMPGFTPSSMYPRMWLESGVAYADLIDRLLAAALVRDKGLR
jgi:D-alanine-D-alanine ligase